MPEKNRNFPRKLLIVAALFALPGLGYAEVDTSEWVCE